MKYGPHTEAAEQILEQIRSMTLDQAITIVNSREPAWSSARFEAMMVPGRKAATWDALSAAYDVVFNNPGNTAIMDFMEEARWDWFWLAVSDALVAVITRDLITEDQFDLLYGPWRSAMD